jgi:abortive infection bacteriophage resistance protein
MKYGSECYRNAGNFVSKQTKDGEEIHTKILDCFDNECTRQKNVPFVKHHLEKYEGRFPVWVAIDLFTFGNLSSLYDILKPEDKVEISRLYGTKANTLGSWILSLVEVRNICAHYGRLYNLPLKQTPFLYKEYKKFRTGSINKLFPVIITIKRMLKDNENVWNQLFEDLDKLMTEYSDVVRLSFIGFPKDWRYVLQEEIKSGKTES